MPTQTRDDQGRLLASVFLDDDRIVNVEVVREGLALTDRQSKFAYHGEVFVRRERGTQKGSGIVGEKRCRESSGAAYTGAAFHRSDTRGHAGNRPNRTRYAKRGRSIRHLRVLAKHLSC